MALEAGGIDKERESTDASKEMNSFYLPRKHACVEKSLPG